VLGSAFMSLGRNIMLANLFVAYKGRSALFLRISLSIQPQGSSRLLEIFTPSPHC